MKQASFLKVIDIYLSFLLFIASNDSDKLLYNRLKPDLKKLVANSNETKLVTSVIISRNGTSKETFAEKCPKEEMSFKNLQKMTKLV